MINVSSLRSISSNALTNVSLDDARMADGTSCDAWYS